MAHDWHIARGLQAEIIAPVLASAVLVADIAAADAAEPEAEPVEQDTNKGLGLSGLSTITDLLRVLTCYMVGIQALFNRMAAAQNTSANGYEFGHADDPCVGAQTNGMIPTSIQPGVTVAVLYDVKSRGSAESKVVLKAGSEAVVVSTTKDEDAEFVELKLTGWFKDGSIKCLAVDVQIPACSFECNVCNRCGISAFSRASRCQYGDCDRVLWAHDPCCSRSCGSARCSLHIDEQCLRCGFDCKEMAGCDMPESDEDERISRMHGKIERECIEELKRLMRTQSRITSNSASINQREKRMAAASLKKAGIKVKRHTYSVEQRKQCIRLVGMYDTVAERESAVNSIPGYETVNWRMVKRWMTAKVKKKRGRKVDMHFEEAVTQRCIMQVIDDSAGNEELIVNANVAYSYEVFQICARAERDAYYKVGDKMVQKWHSNPRVMQLKFSDKWVWCLLRRQRTMKSLCPLPPTGWKL